VQASKNLLFVLLILVMVKPFPAKALWLFKKDPKNSILQPKPLPENTKIIINPQDYLLSSIDKEKIQQDTADSLPDNALVDILADEINYDQNKTYYEALGNAEAVINDKNIHLTADRITYDSATDLLEAFGDIKITQKESTVYGSYASFNTKSNVYELDDPKLFTTGLKLKARLLESKYADPKNKKQKNDLHFKDGVMALDRPIAVYAHGGNAMTRYTREIIFYNRNKTLDWNDLSDHSSIRYTAKEIFFDNTRKTNNLRIKGARMWLNDNLSIPSPVQITTSVGEGAQTRFKGPIIGTRERIGGFALGPRFFFEKDFGIFSLVPVLQMGDGPEFGVGAVTTFNTPGDKTALMLGYGSLHDRFIAYGHQEFGRFLEANAYMNQFIQDNIFGTSQVGQLYELAADKRLDVPFADERGLRLRASGAWAKDNADLYSKDEKNNLTAVREDEPRPNQEHDGFRTQIEASLYTQPIWRKGNEIHNFTLRGRGQGAFRFYDTGDMLAISRFGPALEMRYDDLSFEIDYLFATITGESPFIFDQFIDGSQSLIIDGDYRVNKWFSIGSMLTYNMERERFVRNEFRTEFGPQDFKLRLSYDVVRNQVFLGFNVQYGEPVKFDDLKVRI
jgi:hypothetical protein